MVIQKLTTGEREAFEALNDPDFPKPVEGEKALTPWPSPTPDTKITSEFDDLDGVIEPLRLLFTFGEPLRRRSSTPPGVLPLVQSQSRSQPQSQSQSQSEQPVDEDESDTEEVVLPTDPEVRLVKMFFERVKKESRFSRPAAVVSENYEVESVAAIGRRGRNEIVLCVKWQGYPWSESTWEPLRHVDKVIKNDLVARWGALGKIKAESRPINDNDDDDGGDDNDGDNNDTESSDDVPVAPRRSKRARLR